ncbi:uncharacterized protein LOC129574641 [Sitodiplosis mosellana]|uniref:uncharacterized protein LOC129574641 n=1 Tax=Sitodiplosis mosellana TaxID=263140 RepID=UPI0024440011|nr:uncharacterized protein LOC129574641 [Sitodiplosis mosellana]
MGIKTFTIAVVILTFLSTSFQGANALKCWNCITGVKGCDDPFDPNEISNQLLTDCPWVCVKTVNGYNNQMFGEGKVYARSCNIENICDVHTSDFCETCKTDGCNGSAQNGATCEIVINSTALAISTGILYGILIS